ncbi:dynein light chain Tctex-type protein 2-like [Ylistrum balloti]|uniref:dynein light chain Tctex-type protein 2-like n=1 Tax=Ylistrum balloti TaxID=509963 RepID=UPI002905DACD|nr:dynein light chain Tctex-type protein 2-like [Ylistrum balloti]
MGKLYNVGCYTHAARLVTTARIQGGQVMASQENTESQGKGITSFFKTALEYEDYKSESVRSSSELNKLCVTDLVSTSDPRKNTPRKSDLSEQKPQKMLNRMTAHIRVQSPILASVVKSDCKPAQEQTKVSPPTAKMLSLFRRDKTTTSEEGDSKEGGNMMQLIKLRNIARNVKSIQHNRQKRLEDTGNVTLYDKFRKFDHKEAEESIKHVLEEALEHVVYEPKRCKALSLQLSDKIKNNIKRLKFPRYKIVSFVTIGQKGCQDVVIASRCIWNTDDDNYASVRFENKTLFANAIVFALLHE